MTPLAEELKGLLSADEVVRAEKFRFPELQKGFIAGRALLRMVLGKYCNCAPEKVRFAYSEHHKPRMETNGGPAQRVSFNLSHSGDEIQIAIAEEGDVGIDVEYADRRHDVEALVPECLTDEEAGRVMLADDSQRRPAFLRYWVHKEAFLKCIGCGFAISPKDVMVSFGDEGCSVIRCRDEMAGDAVLYGRDVPCGKGYLAAVASLEREPALETFAL